MGALSNLFRSVSGFILCGESLGLIWHLLSLLILLVLFVILALDVVDHVLSDEA